MLKTNLLFVITKLELGGAQKNVLDLAARLDREKFNIFIFTARDGLLMQEARAIPGVCVTASRFLDRPLNPFKDFLALFELAAFIRRNRISVVHTHSSKGGIIGRWAAALAGVRAVCHTVHGWSFHDHQPLPAYRLCVLAERFVAASTRRFIVVSERDLKRGLDNGISVSGRYALVRYGIERGSFSGARPGGRGFPVIGTIACLKPQKAPLDFVRLAALVHRDFPDARFVLAGDGALRDRVMRRVREEGLEGSFTLSGWRRDIPGFLASLDVFCLTSLWEGLPIAVIEAMASSLPVVCTDTGGVRELIRDGANGFIVAPGDIEGMAKTLGRLLNDGELRRRIGRSASELPEDLDIGTMVRRTQQVYEEMLN
jgi:glycosyltransferase involved in cell wall biosynthesis